MIKIQSQDFIYIDVGYALKDKEMAQYDTVQKKYLVIYCYYIKTFFATEDLNVTVLFMQLTHFIYIHR